MNEFVVHPDVRHGRRTVRATRLCNLVLMMWENEVDAAAMDVEHFPEMSGAHGRALDVPARTSPAPRAFPSRLIAGGLLPQHKVGGIFLVCLDGDARAGELLIKLAA